MARIPELDDLLSSSARPQSPGGMAFAFGEALDNPFADSPSASTPQTEKQFSFSSHHSPAEDMQPDWPLQSDIVRGPLSSVDNNAFNQQEDGSTTAFPFSNVSQPHTQKSTNNQPSGSVSSNTSPATRRRFAGKDPLTSPLTSGNNRTSSTLRSSFSALDMNDPLANPLAMPTTTVNHPTTLDESFLSRLPPAITTEPFTDRNTEGLLQPQSGGMTQVHISPMSSTPSHTVTSNYTEQNTSMIAEEQKVIVPRPMPDILPSFKIRVLDPTKIGDTLNPYILYKVATQTTCTGYKSTSHVSRRYRDFLWLHNYLVSRFTGTLVPPIPEKQSIGRFQDEFVESRRNALERFLNRVVSHPTLHNNESVRLFLESESLQAQMNDRKDPHRFGFLGLFGGSSSDNDGASAVITWMKNTEPDEWFDSKRLHLEQYDAQLRAAHRAVETLIKARKDMGAISLMLSTCFEAMQKSVVSDEALSRISSLMYTIDEYVRMVGAIRSVLTTRARLYNEWQTTDVLLVKRRQQLERNRTPNPTLDNEIRELENKVAFSKKEYGDVSRTARSEIERYEKQRIYDFQTALVQLVDTAVEVQREVIRLWETYQNHKPASHSS